MIFNGFSIVVMIGIFILAMALGALLALIGVEIRKKANRKSPPINRAIPAARRQTEEEKKRRQQLLITLMDLYSGVHSSDVLSTFLNQELERRHEGWRVRIPTDGPGTIYDLDHL